jgi:hypothetical protein
MYEAMRKSHKILVEKADHVGGPRSMRLSRLAATSF